MRVEVERVVDCRSTTAALWPLVADTERTNRAVGMERVSYRALSGEGAARFIGVTSLGGFDVEYEERPTEWQEGQYFHIRRVMRSGPVASLDMRFDLAPRGSGTQVRVMLAFEARTALLAPVLKLRARQSVERIVSEVARLDDALVRGQKTTLPLPAQVDNDALAAAMRVLRRRGDAALAERLERWVREADDLDVARMRPYALADEWGVERRALLVVMLEAVKAGLLELRWEVICPSCRVAVDGVPTLAQLGDHGRCQLCDIDFGLDMEEALEATFGPARAVRRVSEGPYCIAGPSRVPHVVGQQIVPVRETVSMGGPASPGRYRLFVRGGVTAQLLVEPGAPTTHEVDVAALPEQLRLAPGGKLHLRNSQGPERHVKIERSAWAQQAVSARELSTLPTFRREFSSDLLRPGASLKVTRVTLFFSDLTGSTQLYSTVGDAAAFRLVQDHFDLVLDLIEQHGGALVKTIGDAVMAVFSDEMAAVAASLAILTAFEKFRLDREHRSLTHIKLGVYAGSCYMVTANSILDYFGQTVNIAARLQAQADSGELVLPLAMAEEAASRGLIEPAQIRARYAASLKGVNDAVEVARVVVPAGSGQPS